MRLRSTVRLWLDELQALPDYSLSNPSGVCHGKTWRRGKDIREWSRGAPFHEQEWWVLQYWVMNGICYTIAREVVLLQGPRRPNERRTRFKVECCC